MAPGDEILDRALALVEAEGAEALTMRRLAGELGVATTTIYWHVGNRDDLVTAVVRRHGEQMARTPVNGATARDRVLDVARLIWRTSLEHREVTRLAAAHGASTLQARELELAMARELQTAGVVGTAARDAMRAITACVGGFLVVALRNDQTPEALRRTTVLADHNADDGDLNPTTRAALAEPADLPAVFESTLQAVVESPDGPSTAGAGGCPDRARVGAWPATPQRSGATHRCRLLRRRKRRPARLVLQ